MRDNTLDISNYTLPADNTLFDRLSTIFVDYDKIYSYILAYNKDKNTYKLKITVCSTDRYNTYDAQTILEDICDNLVTYIVDNGSVVCFLQPDLSIQCEMFTPYAHKLATEEHLHWQHMEVEDLVQMVYECMTILYNKGYYLNKYLVRKTFLNKLYGALRKRPADKECSLYAPVGKEGMRDITIADTLEDDTIEQRDIAENADALLSVIDEMREILLTYISERQYKQLLFEYNNRCVTAANAKLVQNIRLWLKRDGFNRAYIHRRYY